MKNKYLGYKHTNIKKQKKNKQTKNSIRQQKRLVFEKKRINKYLDNIIFFKQKKNSLRDFHSSGYELPSGFLLWQLSFTQLYKLTRNDTPYRTAVYRSQK